MSTQTSMPPTGEFPLGDRTSNRIAIGSGLDPLVPLGKGWQIAENPRVADALILGPEHDREELVFLRRERPLMPVIFVGSDYEHREFHAASMTPGHLGPVLLQIGEIVSRLRELAVTAPKNYVVDLHLIILAYLDDRSPVSRDTGEPILVSIPGGPIVVGRVDQIMEIADRLPEEFQSKFRPTGRQRLVVIHVEPEILRPLPIMGTVSLSRSHWCPN